MLPAAAAARAESGLLLDSAALNKGQFDQPVAVVAASGLIAAGWGQIDQHEQQQQQEQHSFGTGVVAGSNSTGHDSDCEEAEIDRQLAALAALRQANRRAPVAAAVTGSISAKSIAAAGMHSAGVL
jgi:hypothetical protein